MLPAKAPAAIVARINKETIAAVNAPETRAALDKQGIDVQTGSPEDVAALIRNDVQRWGAIIREAGISGK